MRFIILVAFIFSTITLFAQEESKMPLEAQKLIAAYDTDAAKIRADAEKQVDKKSVELAVKLAKIQDAATKRGDLEGALALKTKVAAIAPKNDAAPVVSAQDIKRRFTGVFDYGFSNGHRGQLEVRGSGATDVLTGIQGDLRVVEDVVTVVWGNGTQWKIGMKDDAFTVQAPDGECVLASAKKR